LHAPVASQVIGPVHVSGSSAPVTATQVPPAPVQAWHAPQIATPQQRPSTQLPMAQLGPMEHAEPFASFGWQAPLALQNWSPGHVTPAVSQLGAQRVASMQTPLAHVACGAGRQLPAPSQVGAVAATPAWQLALPQVACGPG
jgi:hypothetical protein